MNLNVLNNSKPKLLPPYVFERTVNSDEINLGLIDDQPKNKSSQPLLFIEFEKLKEEIKTLKRENFILKNTNVLKDSIRIEPNYKQNNFNNQIEFERINSKESIESNNDNFNFSKMYENNTNKHLNELEHFKKNYNNIISKLDEEKSKNNFSVEDVDNIKDNQNFFKKNDFINNEKISSLELEKIKYLTEIEKLKGELKILKNNQNEVNEFNNLKEKYLQKCVENELLKKENETNQIRLNSINEILILQESQVEKSSDFRKYNISKELLQKWRLKVFDLMIKYKTLQLLINQEKTLDNNINKDLNERLNQEIDQNKIYVKLLEEKKSQLYKSLRDSNKLNDAFIKLENENKSLKCLNEKQIFKTLEIKKYLDVLMINSNKIDEFFKLINEKLSTLEKRLIYSNNRLNILKKSNANIVSDYKDELSCIKNEIEHLSDKKHFNFNETNNNKTHLNEDNRLNNKNLLEKNEFYKSFDKQNHIEINTMSPKECNNKIKLENEIIIENLNNKIKKKDEELENKDLEIEELKTHLNGKESELRSLKDEYDELYQNFKDLKNNLETSFEKQFKIKEGNLIEKLSKMEYNLNEAKREQAKAIVIIRQMERDNIRDKEKIETLYRDSEMYYKSNIDHLQMKINLLIKERNILITTIKKSGINLEINKIENSSLTTSVTTNQISDINNSYKEYLNKKTNMSLNFMNIFQEKVDENELQDSYLQKNQVLLNQIKNILGNLELNNLEDNNEA